MVLKLRAPPPAKPTARPLATAPLIATATDVAWTVPVLALLTATDPALLTPPVPLTSWRKPCSAVFCWRIRVLSASDTPTAGATESSAAGATLTARAAPQAVVVRLLVSLALICRLGWSAVAAPAAPLIVSSAPAPAPTTSAVRLWRMVLVASAPPPLALTPTEPALVQPMAAAVAPTVAARVLPWVALTDSCLARRACTPAWPSPPRRDAPMASPSPLAAGPSPFTPRRLRATEPPIDTAPPEPVALPWPAPATACTWAVILSFDVPERAIAPLAEIVSACSRAWLPPLRLLMALAPPPANPRENLPPMAAPIATATEVASIVRVLTLLRLRSPDTSTLLNPCRAAVPAPLRLLLATATPTDGANDAAAASPA